MALEQARRRFQQAFLRSEGALVLQLHQLGHLHLFQGQPLLLVQDLEGDDLRGGDVAEGSDLHALADDEEGKANGHHQDQSQDGHASDEPWVQDERVVGDDGGGAVDGGFLEWKSRTFH